MELIEVISLMLTEWLEYGHVRIEKYPKKYHTALYHQQRIGWQQIFMGKIAIAWELIQGNAKINNEKIRKAHLWSASMLETILNQMILLWEQRNLELHGADEKEQKEIALERHRKTILTLLAMEPRTLPRDRHIFPDDPQELLKEDNPTKLENWILLRRPAILNSVKQAKEIDTENTEPIYKYFTTTNKSNQPRLMQWKLDRLLHDPYNKKKRHRKEVNQNGNVYQVSIAKYLTLTKSFK